MLMPVRAVMRATVLALVLSLSFGPALTTSAGAGVASPVTTSEARTSAACVQATEVVAEKRAAKKKAKKRLRAAKKKLRKAKRADASPTKATKVKKAKKRVKKAKKRLKRAKRQLRAAKADQAAKCQTTTPEPTPEERADALGGLLAIILGGSGADPVTMTLEQLTSVINLFVPGLTEQLDPAVLQALLDGLGGSDLDPQALADLLGGGFDPALLTDLLSGFGGGDIPLDPTLLTAILQQLTDQLAGLAPGFPAPTLTPEGLVGLLADLLETIGLGQLGQLLEMLLSGATGGDVPELSPEALTALLTSLGVADALDPSQFMALLNGINGGGFDSAALAGVIGGGLDAGGLDALAGAVDPGLLQMVLAQLGGFSLDGFGLPGTPVTGAEADALQQAFTEIAETLVAALLGGEGAPTLGDIPLLGDLIDTLLGGLTCTLLPFLC
ncbi:hypothetical protein [Nocardioides sp.]|uniref:hypothetical protein n=1 Tax=Nocardioides sp. TaxID=35761 RepID=UPI0027374693|nr:hypothetical protein [Nocardioides sp.]MDP3894071.1 hypothetical protein [Nocardioides sp.]